MIITVIQARLSSTRLPGKVLKPLLGKPMLLWQIEQVSRTELCSPLIVATSTDPSDDPLVAVLEQEGICTFRGALHNTLDRLYQTATYYQATEIIRLTGDCPLSDPALIKSLYAFHKKFDYDYSSNTVEPTFPDGLDVEILSMPCLTKAWRLAASARHRQCGLLVIHDHPEEFRIGSYKNTEDLSDYRLTVDEQEDYALMCRLYEALYPNNPAFTFKEVISHLRDHPDLVEMNQQYLRNAGSQPVEVPDS